jgi:ATP-dependent DNA helicase RecQ
MSLSDFMNNSLLLDLETTRSGKIRHIGAVLNGRVFEKKENAGSRAVLEELDDLGRKASLASFVLGHNLLGHDFPVLKTVVPWLSILHKPVIDTLYLSPRFSGKPVSSPGEELEVG